MRASPTQPRKQRYLYFNAPLHRRQKHMTAKLAEPLRRELGIKRIPVRKGDTVIILRGDYAGHEGKVVRADLKKRRIYIEGATRQKADGTTVYVPIHPSKVLITKLDLSDPRRKEIIKRKQVIE
ncbi:MAG: 50S ribosomal protein L24 [Thermoprotei archaeon]|nr:MAG: 50S ribosomal protein L24 [Thermoprotei archaeon]RLF01091.1 MAG: 50S ribosomal protein L24 [Thermoprotei archaeon]